MISQHSQYWVLYLFLLFKFAETLANRTEGNMNGCLIGIACKHNNWASAAINFVIGLAVQHKKDTFNAWCCWSWTQFSQEGELANFSQNAGQKCNSAE